MAICLLCRSWRIMRKRPHTSCSRTERPSRRRRRRARRRGGRGLLHDGHGRLRGGRDRSELCRARSSPSAIRSSATTASIRSRIESERVQAEGVVMRSARPAFAAWLREQGVVALDEVDTRALVRKIRDQRRAALRSRGGHRRRAPRPRARRAADRRQPADRQPGTREPYSLGAGPRLTLIDLGCKRSIPRRLAAAGLEVVVVPGDWDADAVLETRPRAVLVGNGPGDPAVLSSPVQTVRRAPRPRAALRNLPRPPTRRARARHRARSSCRSGIGAPTTPCATSAPAACSSPSRTTATPSTPGDDELVTHVSLNDGTVEGLAGEDFTTVQFHPEAAPGPLDALPFFDRIAETCRSAPIFAQS